MKNTTILFVLVVFIVGAGVVFGVVFTKKQSVSPPTIIAKQNALPLPQSFSSFIGPAIKSVATTSLPDAGPQQATIYAASYLLPFEEAALGFGKRFSFATPSSRLISGATDAFHWEDEGRWLTVSQTNNVRSIIYEDIGAKSARSLVAPQPQPSLIKNLLFVSSPYTHSLFQDKSFSFNKNQLTDNPTKITPYSYTLEVDGLPVYFFNLSRSFLSFVVDNNNAIRFLTGILPPDDVVAQSTTALLLKSSILDNIKSGKGTFLSGSSQFGDEDPTSLTGFSISSVEQGYYLDEEKKNYIPAFIISGSAATEKGSAYPYKYLLPAVSQ